MQHPKDLRISEFFYDLPDEKIAKRPLDLRDSSKLLLYDQGNISASVFTELPQYLPADSLLIFNNSKVIQSRLLFQKQAGGKIEIFILEPLPEYGDMSMAMARPGDIRCRCLVGGAKKWKGGKLVKSATGINPGKFPDDNHEEKFLMAELVEKRGEEFIIEFKWHPPVDFATALGLFGQIPIPPYLNRPADKMDETRYQTVFAEKHGSVAAPTAGLHFTPASIRALEKKGIHYDYVTLHVGAGTFKPVKSELIGGHDMHAEFMDVETALIRKLMSHETVISVGTTAMRTIESLYWMGLKTLLNPAIESKVLAIKQWEVYDNFFENKTSKPEALSALLHWMERRQLEKLVIPTQILIAPPYTPRIAKGIITNFHQPNSTLLLLIAALVGNDWKRIYDYALENDFRFLSYGDSNLITW